MNSLRRMYCRKAISKPSRKVKWNGFNSGFEVSRLSLEDEGGTSLIDNANVKIDLGEKIAIVGAFGSGAPQFAEVLAGIQNPSGGRVQVDGKPMDEMPEYMTGRNISYSYANSYLPQASIMEILTYVLKNQPVREAEREGADLSRYQTKLTEIHRAGNFDLDYHADWIDYERVGASDEKSLIECISKALTAVDMEDDIRALGLRGTLDPAEKPELCSALVVARKSFRERLDSLGFSEFVEPFDPALYNSQSTIGENLLFGTAIDPQFEFEKLPGNELVRSVLAEEGLEKTFFEMGKEVAQTTIELFGDLQSDNPFFDQLSYMDPEEIPEYRTALTRIGDKSFEDIAHSDQVLILRLPFAYTEEQNRLGLLGPDLKEKILQARKKLNERFMQMSELPVAFF